MFIRRSAATTLVDAQMALRSGSWTPVRGCDPISAMTDLEAILQEIASDDQVAEAADRLTAIVQEAVMAGDCQAFGFEQFEMSDAHPRLAAMQPVETPVAANDVAAPLKRAA